MDTPIIISKADFEGRIEIASNLKEEKKLNQHIRHALDFDLGGLMQDQFYYYFIDWFSEQGVIKAEAPQAIKDLFNGVRYNVDGKVFNNPGLKPVIVYFTGARLVRGIDAHITPNGLRDKVNEFSEQVTPGRKAFQANEYENQALAYWRKVETYMSHNKTLFPEYFVDACGCHPERAGGRAKRISIGGKEYSTNYRRFYNGRR